MTALTNCSSLHNTGGFEDGSTHHLLRSDYYSSATLNAVIKRCDQRISNLVKLLEEKRRDSNASVGLDRILVRQSRDTLYFLKDHLQILLSSTSSDPNPLHSDECGSILDDIKYQKLRLKKIKDRIRRKELEFFRFSEANWQETSRQHLQKDQSMLVLSIRELELR